MSASNRNKSNLNLILDKYNFKSYVNTIGREQLLAARANNDDSDSQRFINLNNQLGKVSDALFSVSNSPMYTHEFLNNFNNIENIGEFLQITFENVNSFNSPDIINASYIIDSSKNIPINNVEKNTFSNALRGVFSQDNRDRALRFNLQGFGSSFQGDQPSSFSISKVIRNRDEISAINKEPNVRPTKNNPHLATYQIFNDALAIGNRQTAELATFFNLIPTVEFSRAVPIIAAKFSLPAKTFKSRNNLGSQFSVANNADFLFGSEPESVKSSMSDYKGDSFSRVLGGSSSSRASIEGISTNLDIFLAPQTMVNTEEKYSGADSDFDGVSRAAFGRNGRNNAVIDKMRPFMTIESFEIDVKPTRGLLSYKTAQLNLVLHDRSRMADIAPFIKPDLFGVFGAEIAIEYGWAHPDGSNPYGAILNLMRAKEKYMVVNSNFNLQQNGEVKITLYLAMLGATDIVNTDFFKGNNIQVAIRNFEEARDNFNQRARETKENPEFNSVRNLQQTISEAFAISNNKNYSDEYIESLRNFINKTDVDEQSVDDNLRMDAEALLDKLQTLNRKKEEILDNIINLIKNKKYDPYLSFSVMNKLKLVNQQGRVIDRTNRNSPRVSNYVSFGKVLLAILGKTLTNTQRFNEVQLIFYNTNSKCGFASSVNIANLPINIEELENYLKETITKKIESISIGNLILSLNKRFIQNKASILYGFQGIYTYDKESNTIKVAQGITQNEATATQKEILYKAYYGIDKFQELQSALNAPDNNLNEVLEKALLRKVDFILPKIGFSTEVIYKSDEKRINEFNVSPEPIFSFKSSNEEDDTILRVHIFDKTNTPFQGAYDFINDSINSDFTTLNNSLISERNDLFGSATTNLATLNRSIEKELNSLRVNVTNENNERQVNVFTKFGAVKEAYKKIMPTLTYGSQNSAIINASFQTINEGRLSTLFITRADRELETGQSNSGETIRIGSDDLPLRVLPTKVDLTTFGCPVINFAQSLFFDFGTGTTIDNMYNVTGIKHTISQGKFESGLTLQYGDIYGKFESRIVSRLAYDNVIEKIRQNERNLRRRSRQDLSARDDARRARRPMGESNFIYVDLFEI
tara:strand:+ start:2738 stop:6022 length:3285 start_codon:yes stop_codon:yes gene_type:complete